MAKSSPSRGLLVVGLLFLLACLLLFLAGMFAPRALSFLDAAVCPDGMHLDKQVSQHVNDEGNLVDSTNTVCVGEGQAPVDITPRMLLILFGLALVGGGFIVWSVRGIKRVA
ncbi:MAG TPA: hypothetical protein VGJ22_03560 [Anaerolineales bacterium]